MIFINVYRIWRAITFDAIMLALLYLGAILNLAGPINLLLFVSWIVFISSVALLFTNDEGINSDVPRWFSRSFFTVMIGTLVWQGWFITGGLWLCDFFITEYLIKKGKEAAKNEKDPVASSPSAGANTAYRAP